VAISDALPLEATCAVTGFAL